MDYLSAMNNTHTHTMDNQTTNPSRIEATLTSLEQAVLADLINDATESTGGEFTYADDAYNRGFSKAIMSRKSFNGAVGSLDKKGVIWAGNEGGQISYRNNQYLLKSDLGYLLPEVYGTEEVAEEPAQEVAVEAPVAEEVAEVELVECTEEEKQKLAEIAEYERQINELKRKVEALKKELNADDDNNPEPPKGGGSPKPDAPRDFVIEVTNEKVYQEADFEKVEIVPHKAQYLAPWDDNLTPRVWVMFTFIEPGDTMRGSFLVDATTAEGIAELASYGLAVVPVEDDNNPEPPKGGGSPKLEATNQGKLNPSLYPLYELHNYYWTRKANYFNPTNERYEALASMEEAYPEFANLTFNDIETILWSKTI